MTSYIAFASSCLRIPTTSITYVKGNFAPRILPTPDLRYAIKMSLATRPYYKGLHELGNGAYAWLQPDGGWGWSNAGLIVDNDQSMLVDTLFDLRLTAEMLAALRKAEPQAMRTVDKLINTHANGDHCNGNELVAEAEIIATAATAKEMAQDSPERLAAMMRAAPNMGLTGEYLLECFGSFDFEGLTPTLPTLTFEDELTVTVGEKTIQLTQVGPCHTQGDLLVHVVDDKLIYTGDILFIEGHPIVWVGPISNWIKACDYMLDLDVHTIVPGHGPVTDKRGVRAVRDYLTYITQETRRRYDEGMPMMDAAKDISFDDFSSWGDAERIVINVATLYREFGDASQQATADLFGMMAQLHRERQRVA